MNLNDQIFVQLKASYEGIIVSDSVKGERAVVTHIGGVSPTGSHAGNLCYVEWIDRPMVHQRNGSYRPFKQLWLSHN